MTPPGTPTEWDALETAINAERTQGIAGAIREENGNPGTHRNPEGAMIPPRTPTEWRTLEKASYAKRTQGMSNATREEKINQGN